MRGTVRVRRLPGYSWYFFAPAASVVALSESSKKERIEPGVSGTVKNFPVVETVLSAQFEPIPGMHMGHFGLLWNRFKDKYPGIDEKPPLDPIVERFPEIPRAIQGLKMVPLGEMPAPRVWFISESRSELIQVQRDRFIKNWRKEEGEEPYPRYGAIRHKFSDDYDVFVEFLKENGFEKPAINQCEVSYINHFISGEQWSGFRDADKIFNFWNMTTDLGKPEDIAARFRFTIPDADGRPSGRLHVEIGPALRDFDNKPMYVMNLTARGQIGDGVAFFEEGHRRIVDTFKNLTYERFHD